MAATLLIIEDEPAIREFLAENLAQDDHRVVCADSILSALRMLDSEHPELALIDVGLPDGSGLELCRRIRAGEAGDPDLGVIMLTARAEEQDRVRGFQRGADDYVVKPFHYPELLCRVNALLARLGGTRRNDRLELAGISIDISERRVLLAGAPVHLPAKEFELLTVLARDPYRVHTKPELLERIWGYRHASSTRTLDSHASRLRRRLEDGLAGERFIVNHWGHGYALLGAAK